MRLSEAVDYFTKTTHSLSCMSIACGNTETVLTASGGFIDRDGTPVGDATIFDLASLTKLYTALLILRLKEEGLLELARPVTDYCPAFKALSGISVDSVFGFDCTLKTPGRIDAQPDPEAALRCLHSAAPYPHEGTRVYSDIHAMVLRYIIEAAAQESYMSCLRRLILQPCKMEHTFCTINEQDLPQCVLYDGEHRIEHGRYSVRHTPRGTVHDPKAALLDQGLACSGHAGLFSTRDDLIRLCTELLRGSIVSRKSLAYMARNRTGCRLGDGSWRHFLGSQCFIRHPVQYYSEIPVYMSDQAIGWSGFCGNHLAVDPEKGIFEFYLGNRVLDRLTTLVPDTGDALHRYGLTEEGTGTVNWPDGSKITSSVSYVHLKDRHYHPAVQDALTPLLR